MTRYLLLLFTIFCSNSSVASLVTYEFVGLTTSVGSSRDFKCTDTTTFTCNSNQGLWVGDRFTGTLSYDYAETTFDTWYWGGARYTGLNGAQATFNINGLTAITLSNSFVYNNAPYYETDAFIIGGDDGIHETEFSFKSSSTNTLDSLSMPSDLDVFFNESLIGALGKFTIKGGTYDTALNFQIERVTRVDEASLLTLITTGFFLLLLRCSRALSYLRPQPTSPHIKKRKIVSPKSRLLLGSKLMGAIAILLHCGSAYNLHHSKTAASRKLPFAVRQNSSPARRSDSFFQPAL